jgi:hypothetical protein
MEFVVDEVTLGQVSLRVLRYFLVGIIPPMLTLVFISMLLLAEGQTG